MRCGEWPLLDHPICQSSVNNPVWTIQAPLQRLDYAQAARTPASLFGVDSGGIVGPGPLLLLCPLLPAPRLRLAALEVVAQRLRQTPLRCRLFLLLLLMHL